MQSIVITLGIVIAVCLIHYSYVDFRFRHVDGPLWFWLSTPAPPLLWAARAAIVVAVLLAFATFIIGISKAVAFVLAGLVLAHIMFLIAIEIRYNR
ncbi:MAG: hypothetical protein V4502_10255 [Pseudomonadota bacterium]